MNEVVRAIKSLRPGYKFSFTKARNGEQKLLPEYLDWLDNDPTTKPSVGDINAEIQKQKDEEYKNLRANEYPPLSEFADAMYWSQKGDDTKLDEYVAKCEAVKQKYPKVEAN